MKNRPITIILASYNDMRILRAIKSIRDFDDGDIVSILVVDGGSSSNILESIAAEMTDTDHLISEKDEGVFDALNKGLEACNSEIIGWLGADDFFSGNVLATEVLSVLQNADIFVGSIHFFNNDVVTRKTSSLHCQYEAARHLGFHNPHYATFGRSKLFKSYRFDLDNLGADIEYFIKVFKMANSVKVSSRVFTYQAEGGFSNNGLLKVLKVNFDLSKTWGVFFPIALVVKLGYKASSKFYYKLFKTYIPEELREKYML
tara:strand:- start:1447 stop:2223 length:777 start_codon:yes stop_codon:yes gene_type:complete